MKRIFQSFSLRLAIFILFMAWITATTLYDREVASVVRMHANLGETYSLTEKEAAHFLESKYLYFYLFSLPLLPLFIFAGEKRAQIVIAIISMLVFMFANTVTPGGDRKGCDECFGPIFLSGASTVIAFVLALLWVVVTSIVKFMKNRANERK
jgi:hypothetical protein